MACRTNTLDYADYSGQSPNPRLSNIYLDCGLFNFFNNLNKHGPNYAKFQELSEFQQQVSFVSSIILSRHYHFFTAYWHQLLPYNTIWYHFQSFEVKRMREYHKFMFFGTEKNKWLNNNVEPYLLCKSKKYVYWS